MLPNVGGVWGLLLYRNLLYLGLVIYYQRVASLKCTGACNKRKRKLLMSVRFDKKRFSPSYKALTFSRKRAA